MTQFAQGSLTFFRLPRRWLRTALSLTVGVGLCAVLLQPLPAMAQEADRVVIRGPQGSESAQVRRGTEQYGPIKATDTLWSIANRHRPHSSVTVPQMMAAIVQANPDAFPNGNANEMLTGFYLRIPSLEEIQQLNPAAAQVQVEQAELIARQQRILEQEEALVQQRREEQQRLVEEARAQAEAAVQSVQSSQEQSFNELQQALLRSIESTEALYQDNMELKERLKLLEDALQAMQNDVVTAAEYEAEISQIKQEQEALKQAQSGQNTASNSMLDDLLEQPGMLIALASVPALLMILLTTWLLRRRQVDMATHELLAEEPAERENEPELTDEEARDVLERELMGGVTVDEDAGIEDPFADFADDEEEGTDLDRLSDEMLRPTDDGESEAEDSFGINEEASEFDHFTELDEDVQNPTEIDDAPDLVDDEEEMEPLGKESLDQDDLDALFESEQFSAGESEAQEELATDPVDVASEVQAPVEEADTLAEDDIDSLIDSIGEPPAAEDPDTVTEPDVELLPEDNHELDPLDPDVALDQSEQADEQTPAELDVDELLNELGIEEDASATQVDDIDTLLEQTQALERELKTEPDTDLVFDDEAHEDEMPQEEGDEETPENDPFLDIDDILADAENTSEPDDSETEDDSSRAEDQLAAKLDLARAYLEMGDKESALEAIQEALTSTDISIREEAEELKIRIESE
ncbi:hypothetical protein CWE15_01010 [Aliidiomarina taiwanensis]|uniref:Uncharacterized protein n=1 Tax=Aliidiomarina taiwanensis TaxID=946228 RepID=A0A432X910_9GAMM|nr:FimV/HubP family polar landmark protein [Aliidiomarina taiwanensis]RUO43810.1 hypothetical protein CWE15_01010 [Aliidiomarina taiwanensis]